MIQFFDEINGLKSLFLLSVKEPVDNQLIIKVKESIVLDKEEFVKVGEKSIGPVREIVKTGKSREYKIFFRSYAAYSIFNESFLIPEENDREGRLLCVYPNSQYLAYIKKSTTMEAIFEENLGCYAVNCENHVVFIASLNDPVVTAL